MRLGTSTREQVTLLLSRVGNGEQSAVDELLPILYAELHKLACAAMQAQARHHTLQPTALVHEAYLRLVDHGQGEYDSRARFFAMAAKVMRSVLVDHARRKQAEKRGGSGLRVSWSESLAVTAEPDLDLVALDIALATLGDEDAELARVVELRFFGGLTVQETAATLEIPLRTLERRDKLARMRLYQLMTGKSSSSSLSAE